MTAAIDEWGRLRWDNGYKAATAHAAPDDMEAGRITLEAESRADASRLAWASELVENTPLLFEAERTELVKLIDLWGHALWQLGWDGAPADDPAAKDSELWREDIAPSRDAWVREIQGLFLPPPPF